MERHTEEAMLVLFLAMAWRTFEYKVLVLVLQWAVPLMQIKDSPKSEIWFSSKKWRVGGLVAEQA